MARTSPRTARSPRRAAILASIYHVVASDLQLEGAILTVIVVMLFPFIRDVAREGTRR